MSSRSPVIPPARSFTSRPDSKLSQDGIHPSLPLSQLVHPPFSSNSFSDLNHQWDDVLFDYEEESVEEDSTGDKDLFAMFFVHLLDNFCANNVELEARGPTGASLDKSTDGRFTNSQSTLFSLLCKKLYQMKILPSVDFLRHPQAYKRQCADAWHAFLRATLNAKEKILDHSESEDTGGVLGVRQSADRLPGEAGGYRSLSSGSFPSLVVNRNAPGVRTVLSVSLEGPSPPQGTFDMMHPRVSTGSLGSSTDTGCLSRYEVDFREEEKLGQGGFGAVFKVTHTLDQLQYAVKKIKFQKMHAPTRLPRKILREVRCLARLDHRNVVRYFGAWMEYHVIPNSPERHTARVGSLTTTSFLNDFSDELEVDDGHSSSSSFAAISQGSSSEDGPNTSPCAYQGTLYIQMQLCSFSLKEWMEQNDRTISSEENIAILSQIAHALAYIHSQGLIHRDLKPSNVFVVGYAGGSSLQNACLKIGDFGVATFISDEAYDSPLSASMPFLESPPGPLQLTSQSLGSVHVSRMDESRPIQIAPTPAQPLQIVPPSPSASMLEEMGKYIPTPASQSYRTTGIGTAAYASPEQLRKDTYDEKTDMYSLGIILLELYHRFVTRMERAEIVRNLQKSRKLPEAFKTQYPQEAAIVLALTSPDPEVRPSAADLLTWSIFTEHAADHKRCTCCQCKKLNNHV